MNNYPPGVTGNEYEINGPDYEKIEPVVCLGCGQYAIEATVYYYDSWRWWTCPVCGHECEQHYDDIPEWDEWS